MQQTSHSGTLGTELQALWRATCHNISLAHLLQQTWDKRMMATYLHSSLVIYMLVGYTGMVWQTWRLGAGPGKERKGGG